MKRSVSRILGVMTFTVAILMAVSSSVCAKDILTSGQILYQGEKLESPNGRYKLILQHDGNLVLYDRGKVLWASGTQGKRVKKLVMQSDGNLVLYGPNGPVWATNTSGYRGAYLVVQNDGNVVIYKAIWSTRTAR